MAALSTVLWVRGIAILNMAMPMSKYTFTPDFTHSGLPQLPMKEFMCAHISVPEESIVTGNIAASDRLDSRKGG